jgi:hypothetical protein
LYLRHRHRHWYRNRYTLRWTRYRNWNWTRLRNRNRTWLRNRYRYLLLKKNKDNKSFMIMFCSSWFSSSCNDMNNQLFITYLTTSWNGNWYRTWLRDRNGIWLRYWLWNRNTTGKKERYEIICYNRCTYIG